MNLRVLRVFVVRTVQTLSFLLLFFFFSCHNKDQKKDDKTVAIADTSSIEKQIEDLTSQIKNRPKDADLLHERAKLFLAEKDVNSAYTDMTHALLMDSTNAQYYLTIADIYLVMNRTRFTKEALEKCIDLDPKNVTAILKLAELYLYVQDYKKTIGYIDDALKIDIHNPKAYFMKGMAFKMAKDTAKAVSSFQTAIEQNPKYYEAYIQLGIIFTIKKNNLALQYFNSALTLHPNSVEALYNRGYFLQENGNIDKAIEDYTTILQIDPKYKNAHYNLGYICYEYQKKYDEAVKHFSDAIACDAKYAEAYYMRGLSNEASGNKKSASADYKNALDLNTEYDLAKEGLQRVGK